MHNRLTPIIAQKQQEVAVLETLLQMQPHHPIAQIVQRKIRRNSKKSFSQALRQSHLAVIAEIKRKSPSKGALATIADPLALAQTYIAGGASALSILTDEVFFGGSLQDLTQVAEAIKASPVPILRKDFIISELQIAEAIVAGADAILAIVAVLGEHTKQILTAAKEMGIDVLVEVHNQAELDIALAAEAEIIGINNRDLTTFEIDTDCALQVGKHIPNHLIKVAESGMATPQLAHQYRHAGFDAVLIGETLVKSPAPDAFIKACCHE
jgi:indole-3-glycerol phosphate synthase